ncbi:trifunctional serine/threonine-protein kinase/ATP-binding protein/sensor histidine kinase [Hyalangium sp.]|uniref:trifunctional serine/threonine-protein kinase/ATP-binding protein/sensor histidine kinase n=1 Tax=Hyalangium sp. TaxID=2028555 RepID=UPI002D66D910|nr:AAA family ATPase [Hyalangium sp.]HYI00933.1 AAA family ATPase [Hyalangium sp.]
MPHRAGYTFHETLHESTRSMLIRATRLRDRTSVILKLPGGDYLDRRRTLEIHREHAIARRVEGDGIIRVLGIEDLSDRVALVLEDFGGRSLRHLLDERGPLDVETFLDYALRVSAALGHIHRQGVIHKDIKPQNIIANPDTGMVKIADFSISVAIAVEAVSPDSPTFLTGTLAYMAPEQTGRMNRGVDYRADFYALGATFFELLTNRRPFESTTPLELLHAHVAQMPPSPRELLPSIPEPISAIVLKLLAKDPDGRYQSAWGLISDLEECQRRVKSKAPLTSFPLGILDRTVQFRLPQGLYGRSADVEMLAAAHARATAGRGELLLISGSAGIGKSSLVNELHRVTAASRGRFASGKCDQINRGVPFDAVNQALRHLVRQALAEGEVESELARRLLDEALGVNTAVIVEAVPEMRALLGDQPPSAPLPAAESKNRLNRVLLRALEAFATVERPLALFLDDLQWADVATLSLLQELVRDSDCRHLLPVGAYRDTEVPASHPLALAIGELRATGTPVHELRLEPLGPEEVARMVREATGADTGRALGLGQLIHARTGGNPFSIREFLRFLHDQNLLQFDTRASRWEWDLAKIEAREIPNDIAGLMADELRRLPRETCDLLQLAACLGVVFSFRDLVVVHGELPQETAKTLWSAIEQGFVLPLSKDYLLLDPQGGTPLPVDLEVSFRFLHDRVRQAAYSLLPAGERAERHTRVGLRLLEDARAMGTLEDRAFVILPHLAYSPEKIEPLALRLDLADIHLRAGRRAKASGAYRTACELFRAGNALLGPSAWESEYDRAFALQLELAESNYLASELAAAAAGFSTLLTQARTPAQKASVIAMQATLASLTSQHVEAIRIGLEGLRLLGVEIPSTVDQAALGAELGAVAQWLAGRKPAELLELSRMKDPNVELSISLLASIAASAYMADQGLFALLVLRIVRLSLEHGNSRLSSFGYVVYGVLLAAALDDPATGREFGQLAVELSARFRDPMLHARVRYLRAGLIDHWTRGARSGVAELTEAYKGLMESGDWIYAGHCMIVRLWRRVAVGDPLPEVLAENRRFIEFLEAKKDPDSLQMFLCAHRTLLALTGTEEPQPLPASSTAGNTALAYQQVSAAERHYLLRQTAEALAKAEEAVPLLPFISGLFHVATHAFYHSLSAAAVYPEASEERRQALLQVMEQHRASLAKYAGRCPENFSAYHLLVSAELFRVKGQESEAIAEYERAIAAARASEFLGVEAIACEQAFRFLSARDRHLQASAYLLESLYAYERWGATAKARLLAAEQSNLLLSHGSALRRWDGKPRSGATTTPTLQTGGSSTQPSNSDSIADTLDMTSAMKASQAISSEILFPQLVANLIHVVMESAGAQRGVLVLRRGQEFFVEATGEITNRESTPEQARPLTESDVLCHAIVNQVLQSGTYLLIDDASLVEPWRNDAYISSHKVRSVMSAPIRHRGQVLGLFYLENNLTSGAFNSTRLKVLEMLTSQAAISIENAELYRRLEDYSHTLEDRVADRTAELHSKNAELHRAVETLKAMQAQIVTQEKLASLGALTSGIAHELKNPLNFVSNFAALSNERVRELRDMVPGTEPLAPEQRREFDDILGELEMNTRKIREHGQRAVGIIDGMLQHARGKRGDKRSTNVNQLVEEVVRLVHHGLKAKSSRRNVVIETAFDATVPDVSLVSEDIRRVVLNLVDNACYAASEKALQPGSKEDARVRVTTRWTGKDVEIRVRDNGKGIPATLREKLFTPFFTTKPAGEGTGLGLSISHEIVVVSLGGKLSVESEEGKYAEFVVVLPGGGQRAGPPV